MVLRLTLVVCPISRRLRSALTHRHARRVPRRRAGGGGRAVRARGGRPTDRRRGGAGRAGAEAGGHRRRGPSGEAWGEKNIFLLPFLGVDLPILIMEYKTTPFFGVNLPF